MNWSDINEEGCQCVHNICKITLYDTLYNLIHWMKFLSYFASGKFIAFEIFQVFFYKTDSYVAYLLSSSSDRRLPFCILSSSVLLWLCSFSRDIRNFTISSFVWPSRSWEACKISLDLSSILRSTVCSLEDKVTKLWRKK